MIRRLEKQQRASSDHVSDERILDQLSKLKEDLNYVRVSYGFFVDVTHWTFMYLFLFAS